MKPILIKWILFCLAVVVAGSAMLNSADADNQTMAEKEEEIKMELKELHEMYQFFGVMAIACLVIGGIVILPFAIIWHFTQSEIIFKIIEILGEIIGFLIIACLAGMFFSALFASRHIVLRS